MKPLKTSLRSTREHHISKDLTRDSPTHQKQNYLTSSSSSLASLDSSDDDPLNPLKDHPYTFLFPSLPMGFSISFNYFLST